MQFIPEMFGGFAFRSVGRQVHQSESFRNGKLSDYQLVIISLIATWYELLIALWSVDNGRTPLLTLGACI